MALALGMATLRLSADDSALTAGLKRAQQEAVQAGQAIEKALTVGQSSARGALGQRIGTLIPAFNNPPLPPPITPPPLGIFGRINADMDAHRAKLASLGTAWSDFRGTLSATAALFAGLGIGAAAVQLANIGQQSQQSAIALNALAGQYGETGAAAQSISRIQSVLGISALDASQGYTKLYGSLRTTGLSAAQLEVIMIGTQAAARLSGASASDASNAFLQLKQGLSSGRLAGDELRAVLEDMPILAQAIANQMGVPIGALKQLGSEGKITTDIIYRAIADFAGKPIPPPTSAAQISAAFKNLQKSVAQALGPIANEIGSKLAAAFEYLSNLVIANKDEIAKFVGGLAAVAPEVGKVAGSIGAVVVAFQAWNIATKAVTLAQAALLAISGPAGWVKLAAGVAIAGAAYYGLAKGAELAAQKVAQQQRQTAQEKGKAVADVKAIVANTPPPAPVGPTKEEIQQQAQASADARLDAEATVAAAQQKYQIAIATGELEGVALARAQERLKIEEAQANVKKAAAEYDQALANAKFNANDPKVIQAKAAFDEAAINLELAMVKGSQAIVAASIKAREEYDEAVASLRSVQEKNFDLLPLKQQKQTLEDAADRINKALAAGSVSLEGVLEAIPGAFVNAGSSFKEVIDGVEIPITIPPRVDVSNADPKDVFSVAGAATDLKEANDAVAKAADALGERIGELTNKQWNVNLSVAGNANVSSSGDVLGGI
jgi:tape measure domain-containing protein